MNKDGISNIVGSSVSHETFAKLTRFVEVLLRWNAKINLISKSTELDIWDRHIVDSAQIFAHHRSVGQCRWLDIGSGGGFPGVVLAIIGSELMPESNFELIEADQRKATFLREVLRELNVGASVIGQRVEDAKPSGANVVTARAFAPLTRLLDLTYRHLDRSAVALLLKGETVMDEVAQAESHWRFDFERYQSRSKNGGYLIKLGGISNAN